MITTLENGPVYKTVIPFMLSKPGGKDRGLERKLVLEFRNKYKLSQRQASMFVPLKWLRSRLLT